ncbi:MAG TPA: hypothetical protein VMG38_10075 [Trebonia sp.]|nr:hypothetical protein [Trebonia sp.]
MEVVIGFAAGYWVGTRHGREGLQRAIDSARAIWESPESKRLLRDGLTALEAAAPVIGRMQRSRGSIRADIIRDAVEHFIERRQEQRAWAA